MRKIIISLLFSTLAFATLHSCAAPNKACENDEICAKGKICTDGRCVKGCRTSKQCDLGETCIDLKCTEKICKPGEKQICYDGKLETQGRGTCHAGFKLCSQNGASWSPCFRQQLPRKEICDSEDNDCDGLIDEDEKEKPLPCQCDSGKNQSCYTGPVGTLKIGSCQTGTQHCTQSRRWGPCRVQSQPSQEICDQLDNDCNGVTDDNIDCHCDKPGVSRSCYSGTPETKGRGLCKPGKQSCQKNNTWGACLGQKRPIPEERDPCNLKDDDCDGLTDNVSGTPNSLFRGCYTGPQGSSGFAHCRQGLQTCTNGQWESCERQQLPAYEDCNGKDDDCDGKIDNKIPGRPCYNAKVGCQKPNNEASFYRCAGVCNPGVQKCVKGKWEKLCSGQVEPKAQEVCDNQLDDNCNGEIDEKCTCKTGQTRNCYSGKSSTRSIGSCKDGKQTCQENAWGACQNETKPQKEICDTLDNDCDGKVDEEAVGTNSSCKLPNQTGSCQQGKTACKSGVIKCALDPKPEICDNQDNDCDGKVDNLAKSSSPLSQSCFSGKTGCTKHKNGTYQCKGRCKTGKQTCFKGKWQLCKQDVTPMAEICDGKDNNCDGKVDEDKNITNLGKSCQASTGVGGCKIGKSACSRGKTICIPSQPKKEICDGRDNDCDGKTDNQVKTNKALVESCFSGNGCTRLGDRSYQCRGTCKAGTHQCSNGTWDICVGQISKQFEVCDGKDNDCNGQVDDNVSGGRIGTSCTSSGKGICGNGKYACAGGKTVCKLGTAGKEICNGLDDDCDGYVDNGKAFVTPCFAAANKGMKAGGSLAIQRWKITPKNESLHLVYVTGNEVRVINLQTYKHYKNQIIVKRKTISPKQFEPLKVRYHISGKYLLAFTPSRVVFAKMTNQGPVIVRTTVFGINKKLTNILDVSFTTNPKKASLFLLTQETASNANKRNNTLLWTIPDPSVDWNQSQLKARKFVGKEFQQVKEQYPQKNPKQKPKLVLINNNPAGFSISDRSQSNFIFLNYKHIAQKGTFLAAVGQELLSIYHKDQAQKRRTSALDLETGFTVDNIIVSIKEKEQAYPSYIKTFKKMTLAHNDSRFLVARGKDILTCTLTPKSSGQSRLIKCQNSIGIQRVREKPITDKYADWIKGIAFSPNGKLGAYIATTSDPKSDSLIIIRWY